MKTAQYPITLWATRILLVMIGLIWLILGGISAWQIAGYTSTSATTPTLIAVMMVGNAAVLILLGWQLGKREKWVYSAALAVILLNIVLTITDEFSLLDLLTLLIDLAIFVLLLITRRYYISGSDSSFEPKAYAWGMLIGTSAVIIIFVASVISGWLTVAGTENANARQLWESFKGSAGSSTWEEIVFRGFLCGWFPSLVRPCMSTASVLVRRIVGWPPSLAGQSVSTVLVWVRRIVVGLWFLGMTALWTCLHKPTNCIETLSIFAAGLIFLMAFRLSHNLFLSMGMHMGWNFGLGIFNPGGNAEGWLVTYLRPPLPDWEWVINLAGVVIMGIGVGLLLKSSRRASNPPLQLDMQ